jgi:hypothetical protein
MSPEDQAIVGENATQLEVLLQSKLELAQRKAEGKK